MWLSKDACEVGNDWLWLNGNEWCWHSHARILYHILLWTCFSHCGMMQCVIRLLVIWSIIPLSVLNICRNATAETIHSDPRNNTYVRKICISHPASVIPANEFSRNWNGLLNEHAVHFKRGQKISSIVITTPMHFNWAIVCVKI